VVRRITPPAPSEVIRLLSQRDIAAMKVNAIAGDGTGIKDY